MDREPLQSLSDLLARVSLAVKALPGATALYLYGSAADPATRDAYSDLDLQVMTGRYDLSRAAWPWILNRAGTVELAYRLRDEPLESAYTVAFAGESLYHKVDIGLCDQQNDRGFIHQVRNKTLLWQQVAGDAAALGDASASGEELARALPGNAYVPSPGGADYFLVGELLSSVRYVKARKRGRHLTCWRFLSAKFNALLRCYHWEGRDPFPEGSLNTWDFTALDRRLPETERLALLSGVATGSPYEMDRSLMAFNRIIAARTCPDWHSSGTPLARLARGYIRFIESELL